MKVHIGKNLLGKIDQLFDFSKFSKIAILTDENVHMSLMSQISLISQISPISPIVIPAGEHEKNIETVKKIWEKMFEAGLDRKSLLINFGGGVVCDIGGFAAATFMRGIDFLNIPTTLLAQIDASIGGKNGIDFLEIKNGIGTFSDPIGVVIDVSTLKTLPRRELEAAFGEIIKHGVISGREYLDLVTAKKPGEFNEQELQKIIKKSVQIKSEIVKKDSKEKSLRKILNFGHTIGHAIESLSWKTDKPLLHGEAVAIGMVAECRLASSNCVSWTGDLEIIEKAIAHAGLPTKIPKIKLEDVMKVIQADKKNIHEEILFSLPEKIGKVVPNIKISREKIRNFLKTELSVNELTVKIE